MESFDLEKLEADAKLKAAKQVASLLQRPDQLDRVDQLRRKHARKKDSIEAMLKTAVQSQLDGVRTGLNQLHSALQDVKEIKISLEEVDSTFKNINDLPAKFTDLKDESTRHSQLLAAMENLKHIFTVPELVKKTREYIFGDSKLLHAHKCLMDLETCRDDLFFELHKQPIQSPTDKNTLDQYFSEVKKLSDELAKQLWLTIQRTLISVRREPSTVVTALRIIEREERIDEIWEKKCEPTGFQPIGRPKKWKEKCFEVLNKTVCTRIEGNPFQADARTDDKMWLVRHLEITRQLVIEDLKVVHSLCEFVFPPHYNIKNEYVKMYHEAISHHLHDIIDQFLEGNEIVQLMTWFNSYKGQDFMGNPDLGIDLDELPPLLPDEVINGLQYQYLETMRGNFQEWMKKALYSDRKDWEQEDPPDENGEGFYHTQMPVILLQMIEQNIEVAGYICEPLVVKVLNICISEMETFVQTYENEVKSYKEQHMIDRSEPRCYLHYMMANINNTQTLAEFLKRLKDKHITGDIDTTQEEDKFLLLYEKFENLGKKMCIIVLDEVFTDLTSHVQDLFTRKWFQDSMCLETICLTLDDYGQDFVHIRPKYQEYIQGKAQERVTVEYLRALFARKITFKNYEERVKGGDKICSEAAQMEHLFRKIAPTHQNDLPYKVLKELSEVLKMKDTTMMILELSGLMSKYNDIRPEQLTNLLVMRGDINVRDARQMVAEILDDEDEEQLRAKAKGLFSKVFYSGSGYSQE